MVETADFDNRPIPPIFRSTSRSIGGIHYLTLSVGILCGDELVCLIQSYVTVVAYEHGFSDCVMHALILTRLKGSRQTRLHPRLFHTPESAQMSSSL